MGNKPMEPDQQQFQPTMDVLHTSGEKEVVAVGSDSNSMCNVDTKVTDSAEYTKPEVTLTPSIGKIQFTLEDMEDSVEGSNSRRSSGHTIKTNASTFITDHTDELKPVPIRSDLRSPVREFDESIEEIALA
eukprot:NODE_8532_length_670_cov_30.659963_g7908_i0.p1 GENE.NODE_8532_length_670_cov_30.659963_g7908_i0~~NODE_8532_length_670_cov_30.659963_g7908_i0.p1  ORF type:complete len:131 (+),score=29.63 NODE_8532_length_670_cov_30.659963_g7908_i0:89-481(+)